MTNLPDVPSSGDLPAALHAQRQCGVYQQLQVLRGLPPQQLVSLLWKAYSDWSTDGAARLGAALAYFTLFSIAPVLLVVTGVAGVFVGRAAAHGQVAPWLERFLGSQGAVAAELMVQEAAPPAGGVWTTLAGLITLFLGTSALVTELRQSLNILWRVQQPASRESGVLTAIRSMVSDRLYAFLIVSGGGVLVLASLVVNTAVTTAAAYLERWLPVPTVALQLLNMILSFGLMAAVFTFVYKLVPDAHVSWGDASVGALITALLFVLGTTVLSTFIGTAGGGSMYGTAASVLALLLWVYYSAQVFFFGAEVTRLFATTHGAGIIAQHRSLPHVWRPRPR